ncbi:MAG: hypothetical protein C4589_02825 [Peptococcaceae bacterium]|nr:MAG: hypothetical protein C4589_02825 [Peptococcaceae bacterium]
MYYKVNLLPSELEHRMGVSTRRLIVTATVTVVISLMLAAYAFFLVQAQLSRSELAVVQQRLTVASVRAKEANSLKQRRQQADASYKVKEELVDGRLVWAGMFDDINVNVPVDLWLTSMKVYPEGKTEEPGKNSGKPEPPKGGQPDKTAVVAPARPSKVVIEGAAWTVPSIGVFLNNVVSLPYFNDATLEEFHFDEELMATVFSISVSVKGGGW